MMRAMSRGGGEAARRREAQQMTAVVTGERATTAAGGFNPAWQRHVAVYREAAHLLPPGRLLDLGCGIGHSFQLLAPRETVGADIDPAALEGQERETVVADMRALPFASRSFASVLSAHSIEHVPDPDRVLAEAARVLAADGVAVWVTPNRLTFGRPEEIIDPYHYIEYDPVQLAELCRRHFEEVTIHGLFGSPRFLEYHAGELAGLDRLLALDPLRLRRLVPRRARQHLYDRMLSRWRAKPDEAAQAISLEDFFLADDPIDEAADLIAVCRGPRSNTG
jgi:SAM-dependent methyltransferase